jgi:hypothetical protein
MKPIGQTFYINETGAGVPGVFITKVDVYFKSVSSTFGIELQIRTTDNGAPTVERLPFGSKFLFPTSANPPKASDNASVATTFEFDTPVFVQSGSSYALVMIPIGGNPDYQVWTAEIGQKDALTNLPIYTNNETGDLYLSSNDKSWIPVITEDWKFTIYSANFTSLSGTAIFRSPDEDYLEIEDYISTFYEGEPLYPANNQYNVSVLGVAGVNGAFVSGDYVYQSNGTANVAYGYVYSGNSTFIKLQNTTASFSSSYKLYNANSVSNTVVTSVSQNASIIASSNTFSVPDNSFFSTNDVIYIATSNFSQAQIVRVKAVSSDNTTVSFSNAFLNSVNVSSFSDTNCIYGKIKFNGALVGGFGGGATYSDFTRIILDNVNGTQTNNFVSAVGKRLIGLYSGASANIHSVFDPKYNQMSPQISHMAPSNTDISWSFKGFKNDNNYAEDGSYINISEGISNEFIDHERLAMSRSNELTNLPIGRVGDRSVKIKATLDSANTKISPVIDVLSKFSHFTFNMCVPENDLTGYYLTISNTNGSFSNGMSSYQGNATGTVKFANTTFLRLVDAANDVFAANSTTIKGSTSSTNATINNAEYYSEALDNGYFGTSRYISKNIILAAGQDSEDILAFLAAYRPQSTNLKVYAKIQNGQDSDTYNSKDWSELKERTSDSLQSSQVDKNDIVELSFGFPQSYNISPNNNVCNTTSNVISIGSPYSTAGLVYGDYVYVSDADTKKFNVRKVVLVNNASAVTVDKVPSINSASNVAFGVIPDLISASGAFLNDQNNDIVRYVTNTDLVFDTYSQFSIKIVPVSNTTAIVPRVADMRVLAVQS